jgi:pycsar effector protein
LWSSILLAEQKAAFTFAVDSALLAYLFKDGLLANLAKDFPTWNLRDYAGSVAAFLLSASIVAVVTVVMPRLGGANLGLIYFGAIASRPKSGDYIDEVIASPATNIYRDVLGHCYELAVIAKRKFIGVRIAVWLGILGFAADLIFLGR